MEWLKNFFIKLIGNHRIQGLAIGVFLGVVCALLLLEYRITEVKIFGVVEFKRPVEIIEGLKAEIKELKEKSPSSLKLSGRREGNDEMSVESIARLVARVDNLEFEKEVEKRLRERLMHDEGVTR